MSLQSSAAGCGLNFCPKGNSDIILHSRRGETMKTTSRAVAVLSVLLSWGMWCTERLTTANNINVLSGPRTSSRGDAWFPVQVNTVGGCRRGKESGHCMKLLMIRLRGHDLSRETSCCCGWWWWVYWIFFRIFFGHKIWRQNSPKSNK